MSSCAQARKGTLLIETAGGVHSPTPNGSSQADIYRPLRLPICLVADYRLGGISASISAFESLHLRGYDLDAVLQFKDETYQNHDYLREYFLKKGIWSLSISQPPARVVDEGGSSAADTEDFQAMEAYYEKMSRLDIVTETVHKLVEKHSSRIRDLEDMSKEAK